jgi:uncharacterized membrane protein
MFKFDWSHLKNYGLWVAIASFILLVLQQFGVHVNATGYNQVVTAFLGILVLLGIVNNPSSEQKPEQTPEQAEQTKEQ